MDDLATNESVVNSLVQRINQFVQDHGDCPEGVLVLRINEPYYSMLLEKFGPEIIFNRLLVFSPFSEIAQDLPTASDQTMSKLTIRLERCL